MPTDTRETPPDTAAVADDTQVAPDIIADADASDDDTHEAFDTLAPDDTLVAVDTGPPSVLQVGCADGSREGFADLDQYPVIAGCGGAWDVPGIFDMPASCGRAAGNDGANADGVGCTVTDLCAEGWGVCHGRAKVLQAAGGCEGALIGATGPVFFTTQMSSTGAFACATGADATNDLFGCGNLGCDFTSNATVADLCAPLVLSSHDLCKGLRNDLGCGDWCNHLGKYPGLPNAWSCGSDGSHEALNVTKSHPDQQGGVLCCRE
ncbi:MAG: hypothetical protein EP329_07800 [Deltaproteobacteria bacterium]|nr:MAG: hypothetical protein EP329_07800 [Deltaproteobacteria bacterium]